MASITPGNTTSEASVVGHGAMSMHAMGISFKYSAHVAGDCISGNLVRSQTRRYQIGFNTINAIITMLVNMEIVTIDNAGRLVIPEFIRKKLHLTKNVPLLITELDDDKILIRKLDRDEIEQRLREELRGSDIDKVTREVRIEVNKTAKKKYAAILG